MKKETSAALTLANFTTRLSTHFSNRLKPRLSRFTELCSWIAGQPLTAGESLRILHVGVALTCLIFPVDMPVALRGVFLLWLATALWRCRRIA